MIVELVQKRELVVVAGVWVLPSYSNNSDGLDDMSKALSGNTLADRPAGTAELLYMILGDIEMTLVSTRDPPNALVG